MYRRNLSIIVAACMFAAGFTAIASPAKAAITTVLLDDHFDDSDLATNTSGVGDGFALIVNPSGSGASATEAIAGTTATITEGTSNNTAGIISDNAIDFSDSAGVYTVEWSVASIDAYSGTATSRDWYVLQTNTNWIYSSTTDTQLILILNDDGNFDNSSELIYRKNSTVTTLGTNSLGTYNGNDTDGFTVRLEFDANGYTISTVGLNATSQVALSGTWGVGSNPTYADLFGAGDMYVSTYLQDIGATGKQISIDRISVTAEVPTPAALPAGLAMLGLAAMRRRRR